MKAISLWQPWASLMAMGLKKIETRHWATKHRGPLLIHAAKKGVGWPSRGIQSAFGPNIPFPKSLPLGKILCKVDLIDCREITKRNCPKLPESEYGDYTPGRFMWITESLENFDPIPFRGNQGFFNVPDNIIELPKGEIETRQRKLF